jgi:penicillin-binding protein 3
MRGEMNMNRVLKNIIITSLLVLMSIMLSSCKKEESPKDAFESFKAAWEKQEFNAMYQMFSQDIKGKYTEELSTKRYEKIYSSIEAADIKISPQYPEKFVEAKDKTIRFPFSLSMKTSVGDINVSGYEAVLVKEKVEKENHWKIIWSEKMIFPEMKEGDGVRISIQEAVRGELYDRNGKPLAINGELTIIGVDPGKFNDGKQANVKAMAEILDMKQSDIENKLKSATKPGIFYPVVTVLRDDTDKIRQLTSLPGVLGQRTKGRVYPGGEAFGSLIGYADAITAEELEKYKGKGYSQHNRIGKAGLEQVYEERLRGQSGGEIYITEKQDGKDVKKSTVIQKEALPGENIKLAVDFDVQKKIYEEMKGEGGAAAALNPQNGEVLALVSSPSYDSNIYTTYKTETLKAKWEKGTKKVNQNRFNNSYAPGSTFKLITAAIGLKNGSLKPDETLDIKGETWQADKSWGGYSVRRVKDPGRPVNLTDALVFSDNIYFAKEALEIGKDKFAEEAKAFGLGEDLPFDYPTSKSQIANGEKIGSDVLLANTGYGQGEVMMSPLHVGLVYGSLLSKGDIMAPVLELKDDAEPKVWKEKAIAEEHTKVLLDGLTQVVENKSGTAHEAKISGVTLAGKTGTAELKKNAEDKNAHELGWFVALNRDSKNFVVAMMIEDVEDKRGSHYVVPMVKNVMEAFK